MEYPPHTAPRVLFINQGTIPQKAGWPNPSSEQSF
jgi:hypothetical protein